MKKLIRGALYVLKFLRQQWYSREELEKLQLKLLKRIIKYAYDNVPFYHEKFEKSGIRPDDIKNLKDITKIPITTKQEIKENFPHKIVAKNIEIDKCRKITTSGSTGIPLEFVITKNEDLIRKAAYLRANFAAGQNLFDKWAVITAPSNFQKKKWFQKLGILSPEYISIFSPLSEQISYLEEFNPTILDGHSSALYLVAREIEKRDIKSINPRIIFGTAEILDDYMRNYINSVFKVKMFDQFGCQELDRTAWECPEHLGYHIDVDSVVMEFIGGDGEPVSPGERGEIVYTGLHQYAMPFIRYAIEDIGIPSDENCTCGRGLPMMKIIEGKKLDFIVLPSGELVSPHVVKKTLIKIDGINQFYVLQRNKYKIDVNIVPEDFGKVDDIKREIVKKFQEILGNEGIDINVSFVDEIRRPSHSKLRVIESRVWKEGKQ